MRNFHLNFDHTRGQLAIGQFDQVTIQDIAFKRISKNENGYVFGRVDETGFAQSFTHEHLLRLSADRAIRHDVDYFLPDTARCRLNTTTDEISLLSSEARKRMSVRSAMVESAFDLKRSGIMRITDRSIDEHMYSIRDGAVEYMVDGLPSPEDPNKRHYGGGADVRPDKVSARTLRKWMSAYRLDGLAGLVDGRSKSGRRKGYWTPEELALLEEGVRKYLDEDQPRQVKIIQKTRDMFHDVNEAKRKAVLTVRRQGFWNQRRLKLRESSAHLVDYIMRRLCGVASVAFRVSFV